MLYTSQALFISAHHRVQIPLTPYKYKYTILIGKYHYIWKKSPLLCWNH